MIRGTAKIVLARMVHTIDDEIDDECFWLWMAMSRESIDDDDRMVMIHLWRLKAFEDS